MILYIILVLSTLALAYIIGSLPTGYWLVKAWKGVDLRQTGSGNVGATNVYRMLGFWPAFSVAILDIVKGYVPVLYATLFLHSEILTVITGLMAIVGHSKSVFLNFKGGKSAATGVGVIYGLAPLVAFIMTLVWITILIFSRYVSLASIVVAVLAPILMYIFNKPWPYILFALVAGLYVIWRHKENIERLLEGTERKVEFKKQ